MKISILGTGPVAQAIGSGLAAVGHEVAYGSRTPDRKTLNLPVVSIDNAAAQGEIVINALPGRLSVEILSSLEESLRGKILIDVANAVTDKFELKYPNASLAAALQNALPETRVVKTLSTINASVMAKPSVLAGRGSVFLSGNDDSAKSTVARLLTDLGWTDEAQEDLGDITSARGPEHYFFLAVGIGGVVGRPEYSIAVVRAA